MLTHILPNANIGDGLGVIMTLAGNSGEAPASPFEAEEIHNGSVFIDIDTHDVYLYDAESEAWK